MNGKDSAVIEIIAHAKELGYGYFKIMIEGVIEAFETAFGGRVVATKIPRCIHCGKTFHRRLAHI